jgi:hypothetical protein
LPQLRHLSAPDDAEPDKTGPKRTSVVGSGTEAGGVPPVGVLPGMKGASPVSLTSLVLIAALMRLPPEVDPGFGTS